MNSHGCQIKFQYRNCRDQRIVYQGSVRSPVVKGYGGEEIRQPEVPSCLRAGCQSGRWRLCRVFNRRFSRGALARPALSRNDSKGLTLEGPTHHLLGALKILTDKNFTACSTAGEVQQWMEAFDQAKQQAEYELLRGGSVREKLNVEDDFLFCDCCHPENRLPLPPCPEPLWVWQQT